jgi:hypothetical protein
MLQKAIQVAHCRSGHTERYEYKQTAEMYQQGTIKNVAKTHHITFEPMIQHCITFEPGIFRTCRFVQVICLRQGKRLQATLLCSEQAVIMEPFSTLHFVFIGLI